MRALLLVVLVGCSFHGQPAQHGDAAGSAVVDARPDSSIDGPPAPTSPRRLVIDNPTPSTLMSFPLYVSLDASSVDYAAVTDPTTQLRFHSGATNTDLQFEVDHWDPAGESGVWIKLDVPAGMSSDVLMYFGANAGGISRPNQVWGSFDLVHHMESTLRNSASTIYEATGLGVTSVAGQLGTAQRFAGTGDEQIDFTASNQLFDAWTVASMEFWIYPDYDASSDLSVEPRVMDKGGGVSLGRFFRSGSDLQFQVDFHFTGNNDVYIPITVQPKTWTYIAYSFDGSRLRAYANGVQVDSRQMSGGNQTMPANQLGYYLGDPVMPFTGMIDELRIDQVARSADFVAMQYHAMTRAAVTFTAP